MMNTAYAISLVEDDPDNRLPPQDNLELKHITF